MKIICLILLIFIDFLTKYIVFNYIELNNFINITPFFEIIHIHNYGISFGLFSGLIPPWIIILLGITIIILLSNWLYKSRNQLEKWGLILIIAGAISNIGDRTINNYVLDFIYLHYNQYYWPAFNFADIYISLGILMIILNFIMFFKTSLKGIND